MTKKKPAAKVPAKSAAPATSTKKAPGKGMWIAIGVIAVVVAGVFALNGANGGGGGSAIPPEEAKYMGRLLPDGYEEPNIGGVGAGDAQQTPIQTTDTGTALTFAVADVKANKIVSFQYAKEGAEPLPLLAYVKPSGKLFVGVDYCPPCSGVGQSLQGGTLLCDTCGTKREPESGVGISGACKLYPVDELPVTVEGDTITLEKTALDGYTPQPLDRPTS